jgi:hypothetical protein
MIEEIKALQLRLARLEAKEAILSTFNQYLYSMDTGFGPDILDCYTQDAVLDVPNFPSADGNDLHFEGKDQLAPLYADYGKDGPRIGGGHHTANIAVNVEPDIQSAQVSAYFMTTPPNGVQGGRYEGVMRLETDGKWRWQSLTITSSWGWRVNDAETVSESVGLQHSPFAGHHVAYHPVD